MLKSTQLSLLAAALVAGQAFASLDHPIRDEVVEQVKQRTTSWKPKEVGDNHMRHKSAETIKNSMGHLGNQPKTLGSELFKFMTHGAHEVFDMVTSNVGMMQKEGEFRLKQQSNTDAPKVTQDLPAEWSWRKEMPECLGTIENQGDCGSCWAFTSAGLLSDRLCIHTKGDINVRLSPQEMVNCNYENYGCLGGYLMTSVDYLMVEGAVPQSCQPYIEDNQKCNYACADGERHGYDKYYCKPGTMEIAINEEQIKRNIYENGPMLMGLQIFEDFMNYDTGVYKYTFGEIVGGHAMKVVGYGEDPEEGLYWEMQNQWTDEFGEDGFIKIKHGEIGIDSVAIACMPDLDQIK